MKKIKLYLMELRAPFFTGTIVPILFGSALSWHMTGEFSFWLLLLTLLGGVAIHGGANSINDYYDHKSGNDSLNKEFATPFTGGSRMIQNGLLTPREVLAEAIACFAIGAFVGLYLVYSRGLPILWIGLFGVATAYLYSAPPVKFVHRGIGEIFIGLDFGVLMVMGAYYVQCRELSWAVVLASIPISLLIILILYINEFQDYKADVAVGKLHWVARLGRKNGSAGYIVLLGLVYAFVIMNVLFGIIPKWGLAVFITLPIAIKAVRTVRKNYDNVNELAPANAATIMLHLSIGLIMTAGLVIPWSI